jgi:hypothetical protein
MIWLIRKDHKADWPMPIRAECWTSLLEEFG